jgi:hypothetical protein
LLLKVTSTVNKMVIDHAMILWQNPIFGFSGGLLGLNVVPQPLKHNVMSDFWALASERWCAPDSGMRFIRPTLEADEG